MIALALALGIQAPQVSIKSLLQDMTDRTAVARLPEVDYTTRQASSYDRDSDDPNDPATWYANWDRSQFVRIEEEAGRKEYVMMDVEGPGAVVRMWGTWHGPQGQPFSNGTLRVYLDGSDTPVIEGPITSVISGQALAPAPLSQHVSPTCPPGNRAHNLYLPIPYQSGCRVTYETDVPVDVGGKSGEALYYQINYREYAPGTRVESFTKERLAASQAALNQALTKLRSGYPKPVAEPREVVREQTIEAGKFAELTQINGMGAVNELVVQLQGDDMAAALRSTILKIEADGQQTVWAPVGDFFGTGYQVHPHWSWRTSAEEDGTLRASWVMPHQRSMRISLVNLGEAPVTVKSARVGTMPWTWDDRSMHFHAAWHQLTRAKTGVAQGMTGANAQDVNYVTLKGQGRFVGDSLTIFNGANAWWGEGDEKIYIDGESFPSHFGTGTEDYYGYAWCRPEVFNSPFHAQPNGSGNLSQGLSVNSRWRLLDDIPFKESFKFDMELWHWASTEINYAPTTYWYARPGTTSNIEPDAKTAAMRPPTDPEAYMPPYRVEGALEAEKMKILSYSGGSVTNQRHSGVKWSGAQQVWWRDAKNGDIMRIELPAVAKGPYNIDMGLTFASDYGKVRLVLNGKELTPELDCYSPDLKTEERRFGTVQVEGDRPLVLEVWIVGSNRAAIPARMFGLDYVKLTRIW